MAGARRGVAFDVDQARVLLCLARPGLLSIDWRTRTQMELNLAVLVAALLRSARLYRRAGGRRHAQVHALGSGPLGRTKYKYGEKPCRSRSSDGRTICRPGRQS